MFQCPNYRAQFLLFPSIGFFRVIRTPTCKSNRFQIPSFFVFFFHFFFSCFCRKNAPNLMCYASVIIKISGSVECCTHQGSSVSCLFHLSILLVSPHSKSTSLFFFSVCFDWSSVNLMSFEMIQGMILTLLVI